MVGEIAHSNISELPQKPYSCKLYSIIQVRYFFRACGGTRFPGLDKTNLLHRNQSS
jgi:hypothetical protein